MSYELWDEREWTIQQYDNKGMYGEPVVAGFGCCTVVLLYCFFPKAFSKPCILEHLILKL